MDPIESQEVCVVISTPFNVPAGEHDEEVQEDGEEIRAQEREEGGDKVEEVQEDPGEHELIDNGEEKEDWEIADIQELNENIQFPCHIPNGMRIMPPSPPESDEDSDLEDLFQPVVV